MSFKDDDGRESHKQYYISTVDIKYYVMIDGRNFFDQPIKNDLKTGQGDGYTTGCSLDYPYFKN